MIDRPTTSTLPDGSFSLPVRRAGYLATTVALTLLMAAAVLDATGATALLGVTRRWSGTTAATVSSWRSPTADVTRPALATPFDIEVRKAGGFDGPVRIAVDHEYLRMWDENGLVPAPAAETVMGPWVVWEFDPPIGERLLVTYDAAHRAGGPGRPERRGRRARRRRRDRR